jgi:hypothetical protein
MLSPASLNLYDRLNLRRVVELLGTTDVEGRLAFDAWPSRTFARRFIENTIRKQQIAARRAVEPCGWHKARGRSAYRKFASRLTRPVKRLLTCK